MSSCEACGKTESHGVTLHRFPQEEEQLQRWISSMRTASDGWRPSESAALCSDHFTSDCFHTPGYLHSHAVPSALQSTEETSEHMCDGCEKRLSLIEKSYKLKLLSAQLKVKRCERELSEQSHKMTKLQRKVIVLQTAMMVANMRKRMSTHERSESSTNTKNLM